MKPKKNFKKVNRIKSELMNDSDDMNLRNHHYSKGSSTATTSSGNYPSVWSVKSVKSVQQYDEEVGHITFTVDSGADVTVKHGNGVGLNNFKPDISIDLEVADQRLVQTKGMGEITGKIPHIFMEDIQPLCNKLKDRSVSAMAKDTEAEMCDAALKW